MSVSGPTDDNVPESDAAVPSGDDGAPGPAGPPGADHSAIDADAPPELEEDAPATDDPQRNVPAHGESQEDERSSGTPRPAESGPQVADPRPGEQPTGSRP